MRRFVCLLAVALVCAGVRPSGAVSLDDQVFYAVESMARGRYDQAAQALADVLVQDPDNAYAATRLGLADASLGRTEAARAVLGKVLAANPTNLSALWMLGCLDLLGGHPEQAVARFTAMRQADPGNAEGTLGLGLVAAMAGKPREAVKFLAEVQAGDSRNPQTRFCTGLAYWLIGAPVNARLELEMALELAPRSVATLDLLGLVYRGQGKAELAQSAWEQALAINASDFRARFYLSRLAQDEGLTALLDDRRDDARRAYQRALELDHANEAAAKALVGLDKSSQKPDGGS